MLFFSIAIISRRGTMERIKNILGLRVHNGHIADKFIMIFIRSLKLIVGKLDSIEGLCVEEEIGPLEKRVDILENEEDKAYGKALLLLAELRPGYKKYLPKKKKAPRFISDLLKRRIRLAFWVGMGNEIPFRELNAVLVKKLLEEKRYAYRRKKDEMGWYRGGLFVGKNLFDALEHLEKLEAVDRSRLTVSF
ncbi:MAG: hypothetical protein A3J76_00940 [Candidatus Moranbacteria bacterium RBG_13_45_13]|nr:MAG: hypothetical protein A3J76_00940 [Candidatus Moranbacteria bacterium RBG_13_45_13]